ncbi:endonuclease VII domain-containing protein [Streptomyces sp. NPDC048514]|uniref:endonuclease VII domain-containing protein n=1 Tax=Streptomyces sp. NPDC048514 TaxID=3365564 RepID=UPI003719F47D
MGKPVREKPEVPPATSSVARVARSNRTSNGIATRPLPTASPPAARPCRATCARQDRPKRRYGITEAEREGSVASQGGVCCMGLAVPATHVDHCHETGRVRGVLCFSCNAALGQFKDQPEAIRRAAAYVEGNAWKPTLVAPGVYQLPS